MENVYFENVPRIGDLYLEEVLKEKDERPILFTCLDADWNRYVCSFEEKKNYWMVGRTSIEDLAAIARIPLHDVLDVNYQPLFFYRLRGLIQVSHNIPWRKLPMV